MTDDEKKEALDYAVENALDITELEDFGDDDVPKSFPAVTSEGEYKKYPFSTITESVTAANTAATNAQAALDKVNAINVTVEDGNVYIEY